MTTTIGSVSKRVTLGDIVSTFAGKTPSRRDPSYWNGDCPWVTAKDLKRFRLTTSIDQITQAAVQQGAPIAHAGDILVLVRGMTLLKDVPVGLACAPMSFNQDIRCLRSSDGIDSGYLARFLVGAKAQLLARVSQAGHGTGRIPTDELLGTSVLVPPLAVQQRVKELLEAVENAIEAASTLLTAKQDFAQALATDFLSGRRRSPQFGAPSSRRDCPPPGWREYTLGDVAQVRFSSVDKKVHSGESGVRLCNYMDVWKHDYIDADMPFMEASASPREIEQFQLLPGDVLLTKDSETREDIASTAVVRTIDRQVVLGYHLALIRPQQDSAVGSFVAKQLMLPQFRNHFIRSATGATRYGLSLETVRRATVWLPPLPEQAALSRVIELCDSENTLLAARQRHLKALHAGLLQRVVNGSLDIGRCMTLSHKRNAS